MHKCSPELSMASIVNRAHRGTEQNCRLFFARGKIDDPNGGGDLAVGAATSRLRQTVHAVSGGTYESRHKQQIGTAATD